MPTAAALAAAGGTTAPRDVQKGDPMHRWTNDRPDGKPGRYYVTVRGHSGRVAVLAGPWRQPVRPGCTNAHTRALDAVRRFKRLAEQTFSDRDTAFAEYGTMRQPLDGSPDLRPWFNMDGELAR